MDKNSPYKVDFFYFFLVISSRLLSNRAVLKLNITFAKVSQEKNEGNFISPRRSLKPSDQLFLLLL